MLIASMCMLTCPVAIVLASFKLYILFKVLTVGHYSFGVLLLAEEGVD